MAGKKKQAGSSKKSAAPAREDASEPSRGCLGGVLFWGAAAVLWAAYLLWTLHPFSAAWIEQYYSRGIYRMVEGIVAPITGGVPFSCSLVLIGACIIGVPAAWIATWRYRRQRYGMPHWRGILIGVKWAVLIAPLVLVWFVTFWGAGYSRELAEKRLGMDQAPIADAECEKLLASLGEVIRRDMPPPEKRDKEQALASIAKAMAEIVQEWDGVPIAMPYRVKATPPGMLLLNSTSGICSPLTLEAHVDGALPDAAFVWVGAHELAHIAGCCAEAEATLLGFAAGLRADDPFARYAVALDVYVDLACELGREKAQAAINALPDAAKEDRRQASEAAAKYNLRWLSERTWKVYNSYLKAQGVQDGVKNYARGTSLFVYACRKGLVAIGKTAPTPPAPPTATAPPTPPVPPTATAPPTPPAPPTATAPPTPPTPAMPQTPPATAPEPEVQAGAPTE